MKGCDAGTRKEAAVVTQLRGRIHISAERSHQGAVCSDVGKSEHARGRLEIPKSEKDTNKNVAANFKLQW